MQENARFEKQNFQKLFLFLVPLSNTPCGSMGVNRPQIWGVLGQFFLLIIKFRDIFGFVSYSTGYISIVIIFHAK